MNPVNPLLDFSGLPHFDAFKPELVTPAVEQLLAENRALIARLAADPATPTWDNFVAPLADAHERLNRAWGQVGHMNSVMNSPELRETYNGNLPKLTQYYTELGQNPALYAKYRALNDSPGFAGLSAAQRAVIEHEVRDFRLGGAELPADKKIRFTEIRDRLSSLTSRFSDNLLDATDGFAHFVNDAGELKGIPDDVLEAARNAAEKDGKPGWKFTLHAPSYLPVMQYAEYRPLRELMYRASATRASEFGKPELDNTPLITEIVNLRREMAQLLGFESFGAYSLEAKMAESPAQVIQFLEDLAAKAKPFAQRDLDELNQYARDELKMPALEAWDIPFASEKLRAARFAFSDQEVKQYFPETRVLPGMFKVIETLYGLSIREEKAPVWHADVRFFGIYDGNNKLVGQFYIDLYARQAKRGGAWMDEVMARRRTTRGIQTPVAYLNCNFSPPVGESGGKKRPALFTHDEVITLFHEFGHGLHHLLTQVEELGVSGINGVEWDAVELPSQFMENYCWEWHVLEPMTAHVDTQQPLPRALFDKMLAAKNFQSGMQTVRQIEFSLFDMRLHHSYATVDDKTVKEALDAVRRQVAVVIPPAFNRFPNSFSHIFAGGYAAGYYSYKWAEVLSADAYSLFEERGVLNPEIGARFRDEVLAMGGSRPALESFIAFRGRAPSIDALLRHHGMVAAA
jgi:oligopeptidase A